MQFHYKRPFATANDFLTTYKQQVDERAAQGLVPKPLNAEQVGQLVELLKNPPSGKEEYLKTLLSDRVPPGVDEAAYVKAAFLTDVANGKVKSPIVSREFAVKLLGTMQGGYNVTSLIKLLDDEKLADLAANELSNTLLLFDAFYDVEQRAKKGNQAAKKLIQSWANAEWFLRRPPVPEKITATVFRVTGEINTDDLSPAPDAWSRPDIPLHALAMFKNKREGIHNAGEQIAELKKKGHLVAFVGDVVGTGSSRKSATNSMLWYLGEDIPNVPNKRAGGVCIGGKTAPIFFNTLEDSGALPLEMV